MSGSSFKYRPEIDGLRAIAVVSVILFHGKVPGFSGGFVGVDVFFVISGYLITGILLKELEAGDLSIARFYERRMRRIFPALFTVLLACIPFAWFLLNPYAFWRFGQELMAVPTFVSNILYWRTTNYFNATQENVLLHTWSLSVEEQFYIFFPLFMWLVWRYARRWLGVSIVLVAITSLWISQWGVGSGRYLAAFYLSPTRAYELLIGSMVAIVLRQHVPLVAKERLRSWLAWLGLGLILGATALFDKATPFPGWYALIPTFGTALILMFAQKGRGVYRLLSLRWMVGIGLVSYSAYLWHQPVFVFAHAMDWRPGLSGNLFLAAFGLALGALSWRYVERPFRDRSFLSRKMIYGLSLAVSCVVVAFGGWVHMTNGASFRFSPQEMAWWRYADTSLQSDYVVKRFKSLEGKFDAGASQKVLILGDSYAEDFVNIVYEAGQLKNAQVRTVYISGICQMVDVQEDVSRFIAPVNRAICKNQPNLRSYQDMIQQADVVILAASWQEWSARRLPVTVANMALRKDQRLFVVGPKRFHPVNVREFIKMGSEVRLLQRHKVQRSVSDVNALMKETLPKEVYVDLIQAACGPGEECPLVTPDDRLISYDGGHLTPEGAKYIGERIFETTPLAKLR